MAAFLIDLSPSDMQVRLGDALTVYVDAMRYPAGTENQRAPMWLEHTAARVARGGRRRHGPTGQRPLKRRRPNIGPRGTRYRAAEPGRAGHRPDPGCGLRLPGRTGPVVATAGDARPAARAPSR